MKSFTWYLIFLLSSITIWGQSANNELGIWYTLQGKHEFNNKISITGVSQLRQFELGENFNQFFLLASLGLQLNKSISFSVGYRYGVIDNNILESESQKIFENRFLEEATLDINLKKSLFSNRLRLEQRFLNSDNHHTTQHWIRYRAKLKIPLSKTFYVDCFDEVIFDISQGTELFQQNRIYVALGVKACKHCDLELGYMNHQFLDMNFDRLQVGLYFH